MLCFQWRPYFGSWHCSSEQKTILFAFFIRNHKTQVFPSNRAIFQFSNRKHFRNQCLKHCCSFFAAPAAAAIIIERQERVKRSFWQPINGALHQSDRVTKVSNAREEMSNWFLYRFGCNGIGTMIRTILLHVFIKKCLVFRYMLLWKTHWVPFSCSKQCIFVIILIVYRILVYGIVTLLLSAMCQYT